MATKRERNNAMRNADITRARQEWNRQSADQKRRALAAEAARDNEDFRLARMTPEQREAERLGQKMTRAEALASALRSIGYPAETTKHAQVKVVLGTSEAGRIMSYQYFNTVGDVVRDGPPYQGPTEIRRGA
jgi:hypothetical protein